MPRVSEETIEKLRDFLDSLPEYAKNKCALCNETLTHLVKSAEAETGAGTATVTRELARHIDDDAAPGGRPEGKKLQDRIRYYEGTDKIGNSENNIHKAQPIKIDTKESPYQDQEFMELRCTVCNELFDAPYHLWHCPVCDHHWPMGSYDDCKNCHDAKEPETPNTVEVEKGTVKKYLDSVKQYEQPPEPLPHNHRAQGTGENEWYTPQEYIRKAREVLGDIDLDPATSKMANQEIQALNIYTVEEDGLSREWQGRVWLNPPYSQPAISDFSNKMANEWKSGRLQSAIVLTHNYTDTRWFQLLASECTAICFTRGRIAFINQYGEKAAPTQGQAFFYFGKDLAIFTDVFKDIGFVVEVK